MTDRKFTVQLERDPETGDIVLPIPREIVSRLELAGGDSVTVKIRDHGMVIQRSPQTDSD